MEARFSASVQTGPGAHPASCAMGTGSFPGVKSGRGATLTPHPLLVPLFVKEYSYTSTLPMGRTACTEPQCLYKGDLYLSPLLILIVLATDDSSILTNIGEWSNLVLPTFILLYMCVCVCVYIYIYIYIYILCLLNQL